MSPKKSKQRLSSGLLSFPVTHFDADLRLNLDSYGSHVEWLSGFGAAALFAAGGTGEFFSLTPGEIGQVTKTAKAASGSVPIIAGCGYGTALAQEIAQGRGSSGRRPAAAAALPDRGAAGGASISTSRRSASPPGSASSSITGPIP